MTKMNVGTTSVWMKCWRGFMAKMNDDTASVWMKCWHGFMAKMNVGTASVWMKCRCGLNANKMSRQLYSKRRVLVQLHYKGKWWCNFIANASANIASWKIWMLAWLQYKDKCWHDFMVKTLDVATLQRLSRWLRWKDKCWCSLIAKKTASTTSRSSTSNSIIVLGTPVITLLPRWLPLWEHQGWILLRDCCCKAIIWWYVDKHHRKNVLFNGM